jgi:hypothetical protein
MKKLINLSVFLLTLTMVSCKKNSDPTIEPITAPVYRIEFTQGENYKTVKKSLEFGEGTLLKGFNGKIIFKNEDLPNPSYVFETEGTPGKLNLVLHIEDNGASEITQFSFKVFKNGKQVMSVSHSASGNANKEHRISI